MRKACVIYCRISKDRIGEAAGVERQEQDCRKLALDLGFIVIAVFIDNDISGYSGKKRPGFIAAMEMLKAGVADTLIAWHPDRITRQPRELEDIIDLLEATGAKVLTALAGEYDLGTASGRMTARIVGSVARGESEHKGERLKRKHQEIAEQGRFHGGTRPFGYLPDGTIVPEEAQAIKEAATKILQGRSMRSIARDWNERELRTTKGNAWLPQVVRRMMLQPYLCGDRIFRGKVIGPTAWKPILDRETFDHVGAILRNPARLNNGGVTTRKHLLSGILRCGKCGTPITTAVVNKKSAYTCKKDAQRTGCGALTVIAEPVEALIKALVIDRIARSPKITGSARHDRALKALYDDLNTLRSQIERLEEAHFIESNITKARYLTMRAELDDRRLAIEGKLASTQGETVLRDVPRTVEGLEERWDREDVDWRRRVILSVLEYAVILPAAHRGQRFTPARVKPMLRQPR